MQTVLKQNKKIHNELTREIDLKALEHAPDYVQKKFNELDDSNPIKKLWILRIKTLLSNNEMAINLTISNIGIVKNKTLPYDLYCEPG